MTQRRSDPIRIMLDWIASVLGAFLHPPVRELPPPRPDDKPELDKVRRDGWEPFAGPIREIPKGLAERIEVYGDPSITYTRTGKIRVARKFARGFVVVPASALPSIGKRIYMNKKVVPYLREALRRASITAPDYIFERVGCYNPRHMRHDKRMPLSDHTWGIAFDINASRNRARYRRPGEPLPFAPGWEKYSDIPREVVDAFESVGFTWGGRWGNSPSGGFIDPMHFSLRA